MLLRYTAILATLKIWISGFDLTVKMLKKQVVDEFGFASLSLNEEDFLDPDNVIQLGYAPNRIDLLTDFPGVDFSECFEKEKWKILTELQSISLTKKA